MLLDLDQTGSGSFPTVWRGFARGRWREASFARWLDQLRPRRKIPSATKRTTPMNLLSGYRTYIVAAVMLLVGLAGLAGIDIPSFEGHPPASLVMEALAFFFLRKGLKTVPGTV